MADFSTPFGEDGERRLPTSTEREQGFLCGAGQRELFNGMFNRIEAEIGEVIGFAGIAPTDDRFTQLREAIEALIAAATGGGDTSQFLLVSQARARLLIYPEASTADGKIVVVAPSTGQVRVPAGVSILHRGIYSISTGDTIEASRTFNTDASKIYHLRLNLSTGVYSLNDLSSGTYNPGALAETNVSFDSSYDNVLIARVITNSSNVATITNLVNKNRLVTTIARTVSTWLGASYGISQTDTYTYDLARTPRLSLAGYNEGVTGDYRDGQESAIVPSAITRYGCSVMNFTASEGAGGNYAFPYSFNVEA